MSLLAPNFFNPDVELKQAHVLLDPIDLIYLFFHSWLALLERRDNSSSSLKSSYDSSSSPRKALVFSKFPIDFRATNLTFL